ILLSSRSTEKRVSAGGFAASGLAWGEAGIFWANRADTSIMETVNTFKKLRMRSSNRDVGLPMEIQNTLNHCIGRKPLKTVNRKSDCTDPIQSEHFHVDRQILLGVFADRFHQVPRLHQHLVTVVVKRGI